MDTSLHTYLHIHILDSSMFTYIHTYTCAWGLLFWGLWFIGNYNLKPLQQIFSIDSNVNLPMIMIFILIFWQLWLENAQNRWMIDFSLSISRGFPIMMSWDFPWYKWQCYSLQYCKYYSLFWDPNHHTFIDRGLSNHFIKFDLIWIEQNLLTLAQI